MKHLNRVGCHDRGQLRSTGLSRDKENLTSAEHSSELEVVGFIRLVVSNQVYHVLFIDTNQLAVLQVAVNCQLISSEEVKLVNKLPNTKALGHVFPCSPLLPPAFQKQMLVQPVKRTETPSGNRG